MDHSYKDNFRNNIHFVLAHSYVIYFILFLIGVYLDIVFKFSIFPNSFMKPLGVLVIILASLLIFWAQKTSRNLKKDGINEKTFHQGPYHYTRSPTHLGLFLLFLGFGIIANAFFVVLTTVISFVISKFIFIEHQEKILADKYGAPYVKYKKTVKF